MNQVTKIKNIKNKKRVGFVSNVQFQLVTSQLLERRATNNFSSEKKIN